MSFDVDIRRQLGEVEIACRIAPGAGVTVLFGPSGAGKTSVLNMVAGLLRPDAGHIGVDGCTLFDSRAGIDLRPETRRAGYVFQEPRLFPHLSVRANLLYGRRKGAVMDVDGVIQLLGIAALLDRWPRTLSGGEAKRVAIGRALLADPRFLLLDEPLASLDRKRGEEILVLLERLRDQLRLPILLVTHDRGEAERLGDRIVAFG
ncbi:ATP-binding cassette domain-containing protein [Sphingomonas pokkalii]|uniref:Molybdenum ABC transporter ATP-binding protein n=1 Tax=Sphingomonas pokkalii TaxID=2175090 RepID=A0A2U0SGJ8_9SPHN|nr:ATP-binding cassette domain-containing protein [Sphingomonas pokkalii]PVX30490.1 molybdenum ABC transporter ATP-binding protein [Sphingomonas pokkalii]